MLSSPFHAHSRLGRDRLLFALHYLVWRPFQRAQRIHEELLFGRKRCSLVGYCVLHCLRRNPYSHSHWYPAPLLRRQLFVSAVDLGLLARANRYFASTAASLFPRRVVHRL